MYCGMKNIFLDRYTLLGHGRKIGIFERKEKRWERNSRQREELQSRHVRENPAMVMRGSWGVEDMKPIMKVLGVWFRILGFISRPNRLSWMSYGMSVILKLSLKQIILLFLLPYEKSNGEVFMTSLVLINYQCFTYLDLVSKSEIQIPCPEKKRT